MTITLYDISSATPGRSDSPNSQKIRYALAYKGIQFKTEWAELHSFAGVLKALGAPPSDGKAFYSTPTISDSRTGKKVAESMIIAEYLDETYPEKPALFPPGAAATISIFQLALHTEVVVHMQPLFIPIVFAGFDPKSQTYLRQTLEPVLKCKIEEILPAEKRPEQLQKVTVGLSKIAALLDKNGKGKMFFLGDTFSYADCIAGAFVATAKKLLNPDEWEVIANSDAGRWARLVEHCEGLVHAG